MFYILLVLFYLSRLWLSSFPFRYFCLSGLWFVRLFDLIDILYFTCVVFSIQNVVCGTVLSIWLYMFHCGFVCLPGLCFVVLFHHIEILYFACVVFFSIQTVVCCTAMSYWQSMFHCGFVLSIHFLLQCTVKSYLYFVLHWWCIVHISALCFILGIPWHWYFIFHWCCFVYLDCS